jgi:hypothetical protein
VTSVEKLRQNSVEELKLSSCSHNLLIDISAHREILINLSEHKRMVADLAQLHNGVLQVSLAPWFTNRSVSVEQSSEKNLTHQHLYR